MTSILLRTIPTTLRFPRTASQITRFSSTMSSAPYTVVATDKAPAAIGPYNQAVKHNGLIYASGSIGFVPSTMEIIEGGVEAETTQMFKNVAAVLEAAGSDTSRVLKTTLFIKNMADFAKVNKIYAEFFAPYKPARSCVEVARLPKDALVEMEFIAIEK